MGFFVNGMLGGYGTLMSELYPTPARATAQNVLFNFGPRRGRLRASSGWRGGTVLRIRNCNRATRGALPRRCGCSSPSGAARNSFENTAEECISPDYPINTNLLRSRNLCIYNAPLRIMTSAPPLTAICTLPIVCPNS
jgi:hypothetical protein